MPPKQLADWLKERGIDADRLAEIAQLEPRVVRAIVECRYTTSPAQRQRIADALGVPAEQIGWGHAVDVHAMYGHGPQFGRSP